VSLAGFYKNAEFDYHPSLFSWRIGAMADEVF
jgi:hypothetical protein